MLKDLKIIKLDHRNKVTFRFDPSEPLVSGQHRLIQQIVKLILTSRGTNTYRPDEGSNFLNMLQAIDESEVDSIKASLPLVLKTVKDQIVDSQEEKRLDGVHLLDEETLLDLTLEDIEFDPVFGG
jgi:hypothetical protein